MAQGGKSLLAGAERNGQVGKLGATFGGTDFLIARAGGDFNVPIKKAVWRGRVNHYGDGKTERKPNAPDNKTPKSAWWGDG
jgi:hypothetical protein